MTRVNAIILLLVPVVVPKKKNMTSNIFGTEAVDD